MEGTTPPPAELLGDIEQPLLLFSRAEYVRVLRPLLPSEAFQPAPRKLWAFAVHTSLIVLGAIAIAQVDAWWVRALLAIGIGHSLACLAFFGHDLSHRSIIRAPRARYALEVLVWGLRLMPVTVWRRVHNEVHHALSNTPLDCDRRMLPGEFNWLSRAMGRLFTPFENPVRWNPLVGLAFIFYTLGNTVAAFLPGKDWRRNAPYWVAYRPHHLAWISAELVVIILLQAGLFALAGFDLTAYLWCSLVPIAVSSAITMAYIFTNHYLAPLTPVDDPVLGSTSVAVPKLVDWLHAHFSYHTEHHLFPSLNSSYYPLVSQMLQREFPDRYQRLPLVGAWRRLWSMPLEGQIVPAIRAGRKRVRLEWH